MEEGGMEISKHFLLHCPAFVRLRSKRFSSHIFGERDELAEIDDQQIWINKQA